MKHLLGRNLPPDGQGQTPAPPQDSASVTGDLNPRYGDSHPVSQLNIIREYCFKFVCSRRDTTIAKTIWPEGSAEGLIHSARHVLHEKSLACGVHSGRMLMIVLFSRSCTAALGLRTMAPLGCRAPRSWCPGSPWTGGLASRRAPSGQSGPSGEHTTTTTMMRIMMTTTSTTTTTTKTTRLPRLTRRPHRIRTR